MRPFGKMHSAVAVLTARAALSAIVGSERLAKGEVAPEPVVAKRLGVAEVAEAIEHGAEVVDDVLRPIVVLVGGEASIDVAAGREAAVERVPYGPRSHSPSDRCSTCFLRVLSASWFT